MLLAYAIGAAALRYTPWGRQVLAIGGNVDAARLMGLPVALLTGGVGSVLSTLVGVLLLQLIFNLIVFENGKDVINISSYWESVIRGAFLLVVVLLQVRLVKRRPR
jgi:ribose transport system permease protein